MDPALQRLDMPTLESFLVASEAGSFRKAAERLGVGQSAVSRRIEKLEEALGVSLFERNSVGVQLTQAGTCFVDGASETLERLQVCVANIRSVAVGSSGELAIGSTLSFSGSVERVLIKTFSSMYQAVRLSFIEDKRRALLKMLAQRDIDVLMTSCEPIPQYGDGLTFNCEQIYVAVAADWEFGGSSSMSWRDVASHCLLVTDRDGGLDVLNYAIRFLTSTSWSTKISHQQVSREALMNLVGLNLGVTVVGEHAIGVRYPNVTFVKLKDKGDRIPFSITWRPENDNPALRRFISLARIEAKRNGALS